MKRVKVTVVFDIEHTDSDVRKTENWIAVAISDRFYEYGLRDFFVQAESYNSDDRVSDERNKAYHTWGRQD